jgi:hypothetical protein
MRNTGSAFSLTLARSTQVEAREQHRATATFDESDVERDEAGTPIAFRMWRAGLNRTDHGDHFFTEESAAKLLAEQEARGNLFSLDVDHLSLSEAAPPESRKAVGWFRIDVRDGDLWAVDVQWTDAVRAGLTKDPPEWRYFSPAYETTKKGGEIVRLLNCALTNNPATWNVTALATSAQTEAPKMEYEKMTLAALLAAMDEEKNEGEKAAMEKVARAKFSAAFPPAEEKKEETKAASAVEDEKPPTPEKKEEKKAAAEPDGDEAKKDSIAASIAAKALERFDAEQKVRAEKLEIEQILASLPAGDRATYEGIGLNALKRIVTRHHSDALARFSASAMASPTLGSTQHNGHRASMLAADERAELDEQMGMISDAPMVKATGIRGDVLEFNPRATPADAVRFLASVETEKQAVLASSGARRSKGTIEAEALNRVLANQKGAR